MKKNRRLRLNRETLRDLGKEDLGAAGGFPISLPGCDSLGFSVCLSQCFTACGQQTCGPCAFPGPSQGCAPSP